MEETELEAEARFEKRRLGGEKWPLRNLAQFVVVKNRI
jgi:hypothetical protein